MGGLSHSGTCKCPQGWGLCQRPDRWTTTAPWQGVGSRVSIHPELPLSTLPSPSGVSHGPIPPGGQRGPGSCGPQSQRLGNRAGRGWAEHRSSTPHTRPGKLPQNQPCSWTPRAVGPNPVFPPKLQGSRVLGAQGDSCWWVPALPAAQPLSAVITQGQGCPLCGLPAGYVKGQVPDPCWQNETTRQRINQVILHSHHIELTPVVTPVHYRGQHSTCRK